MFQDVTSRKYLGQSHASEQSIAYGQSIPAKLNLQTSKDIQRGREKGSWPAPPGRWRLRFSHLNTHAAKPSGGETNWHVGSWSSSTAAFLARLTTSNNDEAVRYSTYCSRFGCLPTYLPSYSHPSHPSILPVRPRRVGGMHVVDRYWLPTSYLQLRICEVLCTSIRSTYYYVLGYVQCRFSLSAKYFYK